MDNVSSNSIGDLIEEHASSDDTSSFAQKKLNFDKNKNVDARIFRTDLWSDCNPILHVEHDNDDSVHTFFDDPPPNVKYFIN